MLISQYEAAERLGISRQAANKWKNQKPVPGFLVLGPDGKYKVEDKHPEWIARVTNPAQASRNRRNARQKPAREKAARKEAEREELKAMVVPEERAAIDLIAEKIPAAIPAMLEAAKKAQGVGSEDTRPNQGIENPPMQQVIGRQPVTNPEDADMIRKARLAELHNQIFSSKIKEEKAKQEEIKTLELKRDLAPVDLVRHFFSFAESLIQRIYRKPNEIEPQLAALFLAKENKKATLLMVRELESLVIDAQKDLIKAIKDEGFRIKGVKVSTGDTLPFEVGEAGKKKEEKVK
jgi:hypothetical protein